MGKDLVGAQEGWLPTCQVASTLPVGCLQEPQPCWGLFFSGSTVIHQQEDQ